METQQTETTSLQDFSEAIYKFYVTVTSLEKDLTSLAFMLSYSSVQRSLSVATFSRLAGRLGQAKVNLKQLSWTMQGIVQDTDFQMMTSDGVSKTSEADESEEPAAQSESVCTASLQADSQPVSVPTVEQSSPSNSAQLLLFPENSSSCNESNEDSVKDSVEPTKNSW